MSHQDEHLKVQERWYEKLHNWEKALQSYKDRLAENPHDIELVLGQMRCMEALGDWYVIYLLFTKLVSGGFLLTLAYFIYCRPTCKNITLYVKVGDYCDSFI